MLVPKGRDAKCGSKAGSSSGLTSKGTVPQDPRGEQGKLGDGR